MKRILNIGLVLALVFATSSFQSCSRKSGCPAYETTKTKTKRGGDLSRKRGDSALFPKKMRRRG
ncbi:MAG: hypothetical protein DA408_16565 [Bacteroidetes bacterium]|nr:MAG: hypothetical protein DA408_16565 [Bacteroidota bacterium]